jgi:predicted TIM-barrel fold metal-dependent hydrolase
VRELSLAPSEYIRRQVRFTPFPFEDTGALIVAAGEDLFLFSTDYPHPEGGHDPLGKFEASLDRSGIGEKARDKFYARNFRDMMSLPG